MRIGITGANGNLGRVVIAKLKEIIPSNKIVALVRDEEKAKGLGVEIREFDYDEAQNLDSALKDIDKLYLISSTAQGHHRVQQHSNVINACELADVKQIVYTSLLHADTSPLEIGFDHSATEAILKASSVTHTILRHGWYTENYAVPAMLAIQHNEYLGSAENSVISAAPRSDYAQAAVSVLVNDGHEDKTYELGCDYPFSFSDLAKELSVQTGKTIPFRNVKSSEHMAYLSKAGLPEPFAKAIVNWDEVSKQGALTTSHHHLSMLIGRPTTPLAESVKQLIHQ